MAIRATIFIPTYNGEAYLDDILRAVFAQRVDYNYEVLIIDSGSTDNTLSIVRRYQNKHSNIRLKKIPNEEFGHGKTRNLAAQMAKGEFVAYLSHDAIPSHDKWLYEMLKPFEINEKIVAVMGKQIPRSGCFPLLKYEIESVFSGFGPDFGTTIFYKDAFMENNSLFDTAAFYSDVNSAARRSSLIGRTPYRDVTYAEDQLLGRDVLDAGLYKAYAPRGSVVHSNDLSLSIYKKRMFDETLALRRMDLAGSPLKRLDILRLVVRGVVRDAMHILKDASYSRKRKLYWLFLNPFFHFEKWRGVNAALKIDPTDSALLEKNSLESQNKNKH